MSKICIGIVAYDGLEDQVAEDYMRLMFHLGRRHPEHEFQLAIKGKSEQFRARNAIVKAAIQFGADYLWMLDDDHIIDTGCTRSQTNAYDLPIHLVDRLEENPNIGVVGALYYQRGGSCYPVIMQERNGLPYFMLNAEVSGRMQKVDVTGGGCMMIRMSVFDKIKEPWFAPEHEFGTDIQLCKQVRAAGYEVWCDTSLEIGHLKREREMITSRYISSEQLRGADNLGTFRENPSLARYREDAEDYLGLKIGEMAPLANQYNMSEIRNFQDIKEYYASKGKEQLARQVLFHHTAPMIMEMEYFHNLMTMKGYGADIGCGSAPVTFELALSGHKMDFIDLDGAGAYEFTKWRAEKHGVQCGWKLEGPYDYIFMLDSLEHIEDWKSVLQEVRDRLKNKGSFVTNYFRNQDYENPEHISMDKDAVSAFLKELGLRQINEVLWVKETL